MPTAIVYRLLQVIVICALSMTSARYNLWAYKETPEGGGNIWVESTPAYQAAIDNQTDYSTLPYCRRACVA